jgi:hypothetical protein
VPAECLAAFGRYRNACLKDDNADAAEVVRIIF